MIGGTRPPPLADAAADALADDGLLALAAAPPIPPAAKADAADDGGGGASPLVRTIVTSEMAHARSSERERCGRAAVPAAATATGRADSKGDAGSFDVYHGGTI